MSDDAHPRAAQSSSRWIFSPGRDAALIIATPLLILPFAIVLRGMWSDAAFILLVGAFGQLGHCLPGLIRAYGDRELFDRYRTRFVTAPLVLGAACLLAVRWNLDVLVLVGVTWAVWHALMQTYGFLRIYTARSGIHSNAIRWLEFGMCVLWFGGAILLNEKPLALMLLRWYGAGGFLLSPELISIVRIVWFAGLVTVTALYVGTLVWSWVKGSSLPVPSIMVLISSAGFYWFAYAGATNILVGAALFEVFHDVQYLAIVWLFNRRRVDQQANVGGLVKFIFRRSGAMVGVYIGLVFAFGGLRFVEGILPMSVMRDALTALLAMAGLLHYYYDGFIWKVRDPATRASLGIENDTQPVRRITVPGSIHALKWTAGVLPIVLLACSGAMLQRTELSRWLSVRHSLPECAAVQRQVDHLLKTDSAHRSSGHAKLTSLSRSSLNQ